jgi:hypothetical protein
VPQPRRLGQLQLGDARAPETRLGHQSAGRARCGLGSSSAGPRVPAGARATSWAIHRPRLWLGAAGLLLGRSFCSR